MQTEKKRGWLLSVWLVLLPIANTVTLLPPLWMLLTFNVIILPLSRAYAYGEDIFFSVIVLILNIVFSYAAWKWKKWGVFGLGFMSLVALFMSVWSFYSIELAPVGLVGIIVLIILVRRVWKYF